eukprot:CAMPEP_0201555156 /NCGR_PEP_ID=MMETSP0173_2-20130828/47059_1 /ASSEMBLY_ACC=CAM_ASM_000268 /TAXON_ID=218659 /ORGANISM="Vexillifera sp., Strain DIVA3 564/2" /LENGTH=232 /DNA_ID=CAMNT_0047966807 /DNA_START=124 /DNA_END=819 /DNA_ORIENTATION=+
MTKFEPKLSHSHQFDEIVSALKSKLSGDKIETTVKEAVISSIEEILIKLERKRRHLFGKMFRALIARFDDKKPRVRKAAISSVKKIIINKIIDNPKPWFKFDSPPFTDAIEGLWETMIANHQSAVGKAAFLNMMEILSQCDVEKILIKLKQTLSTADQQEKTIKLMVGESKSIPDWSLGIAQMFVYFWDHIQPKDRKKVEEQILSFLKSDCSQKLPKKKIEQIKDWYGNENS